jgi:hypothetical protein
LNEQTIITIIASVLFFGFGFGAGWVVGKRVALGANALDRSLVLIIVMVIWSLSMVVDLADPAYETPQAVHALAGLIVGFFYRSVT